MYKRFINLFNKENFVIDSEHRNNFIEMGLCKKFEINNSDICQIFSIILRLCSENKKEDIKKLLEGIIKIGEITENLKGKNLSNFIEGVRSGTISLDDFIDSLIAGNQETLDILHSITDDYKKIMLEDYKKENRKKLEEQIINDAKEKGLVKISQKNLMDYIFNEISYEEIISLIRGLCQNDTELKSLCGDNLDKLIECKKEKERIKELSKDERNKLKLILNYLYDNHYNSLIRYVNFNTIKIDGNIRIMNDRKMPVVFENMKNGELYKLLCDLEEYKKIEKLINK